MEHDVSHKEFLLDSAAIVVISVAICFASQRLLFMTFLVPTVTIGRFFLWRRVTAGVEGKSLKRELLFFTGCTLLGGFNDWNSVVHHRIYDYSVPHFFPMISTIPIWMLLYWGMILRFLVTLFRWRTLSPPDLPENTIYWKGRAVEKGWLKISLELLLVLSTRQAIYQFYDHPLFSWIPFLLGLGVWSFFFRGTRHDRILIALFFVGGTAIEILYIQVGELHAYQLGWLGGVPLWITLWWLLAVLIWKDLSLRIQTILSKAI